MSVEKVIMNKKNGAIGLGIRLQFLDKSYEHALEKLPGYSIFLRSNEIDAWAIFSGKNDAQGPWILICDKNVFDNIEILSDL